MTNFYSNFTKLLSSSTSSSKNPAIFQNIQESIPPIITIEKLDVKIEKYPIELDETSPFIFRYKTPYFRASATLKIPPLLINECYKIGWIQACTKMDFFNTYGDIGYWEFPDLLDKTLTMISDSDGRNFPWYGNKTESVIISGPILTPTVHTVSMNDNFCPRITWGIPISDDSKKHKPRLTNVKRDQEFLTWLVAWNIPKNRFMVLKTFTWRIFLEIAIEPCERLGRRAKLIEGVEQEQPKMLENNIDIPVCALYPSNANGSQILVWRRWGKGEKPYIVVAPKMNNLNCTRITNRKKWNTLSRE